MPDTLQAANADELLPPGIFDTTVNNRYKVAFDTWVTGDDSNGTVTNDTFSVSSSGTITKAGPGTVGTVPDNSSIKGLGPGRAIIYGMGGNDSISADTSTANPSVLSRYAFAGGRGAKDTGSNGTDILTGGAGTDTLFGGANNDTINLNMIQAAHFANGAITVGQRVTVDGGNGTGGNYTFALTGTSGADTVTFNSGSASINTLSITEKNVTAVQFDGKLGGDTVTVSGTSVTLTNPQNLAALTISNNGMVKVAGHTTANNAAGTILMTQLPTITSGSLDLDNNSMVIDYVTEGTLITDVRGYLHNGRLTTTSSYRANTKLGYMKNTEIYPQYTTFAGVSVDSTSLLIKYTYAGDSDLDGDADGVDIGNWATNFTGELNGLDATKTWRQGDWDYDGDVDGADSALWAEAFTGELGGGGLRPGGEGGGGGSDDLATGRGAIGPVEVSGPVDPEAIAILKDLAKSSVPELYDVAWLWK